ncbi:MAG: ferrous iron transport protein A [Oscillospiraceae bacterium]|nr:ferrous iron transport protein A [Oscillospiraceae bacterium]
MDTPQTLADLQENKAATVFSLLAEGGMRRRLRDIGLIEGTKVRCLNRGPSGDPSAYLIRGAVIALRREDSSKVIVR